MRGFDACEERVLLHSVRAGRQAEPSNSFVADTLDINALKQHVESVSATWDLLDAARQRAATAERASTLQHLGRVLAGMRPASTKAAVSAVLAADVERSQCEQGECGARVRQAAQAKMAATAADIDAAQQALLAARKSHAEAGTALRIARAAAVCFERFAHEASTGPHFSEVTLPQQYKALDAQLRAFVDEARAQLGAPEGGHVAGPAAGAAAAPAVLGRPVSGLATPERDDNVSRSGGVRESHRTVRSSALVQMPGRSFLDVLALHRPLCSGALQHVQVCA